MRCHYRTGQSHLFSTLPSLFFLCITIFGNSILLGVYMRLAIYLMICVCLYAWFFFSGCDLYVSSYSCKYIEEEAPYQVMYWRNIESNDSIDDGIFIGEEKGIVRCNNRAREFAAASGEKWNYRSYLCVLIKKDGDIEKHRYEDRFYNKRMYE